MSTKVPVMTDRFIQAVAYAAAIHAGQIRKGTDVPYLAHLLGVASLVLEAGGDEDEAIAGLLHDSVEDCGGMPRYEDVRARFGSRVADIVLACSDSTDPEKKREEPYWPRKEAYLQRLAREDDRTLIVSLADKVHNSRAIVTDLQRGGPKVLEKFNGSLDEVLKYYAECLRIGEERGAPAAVVLPLRTAVDQMHRLSSNG